MSESTDEFRPVSFGDSEYEQQGRAVNFTRRLKQMFQKAPPQDPELAGQELTEAGDNVATDTADVSADTEDMVGIDDAFQDSKTAVAEARDVAQAAQTAADATTDAGVELTELGGELGGEAVEGGLGTGLDAGVEMTDIGMGAGESAADAGLVGVGEAGAEDAGAEMTGVAAEMGAEEALGGGPEDPIADVVALGTLIAGGVAALFAGTPPNVQSITGDNIGTQITKLDHQATAAKAAGKTTQAKVAQNLADSMTKAQLQGRNVYSVMPVAGGARKLVMTLSPTGLQNSIAAVKANPSAFVGVDTRVLTAMGLNPLLSTLAGSKTVAAQSAAAILKSGFAPNSKEANSSTAGTTPYLGGQYAISNAIDTIVGRAGGIAMTKAQIIANQASASKTAATASTDFAQGTVQGDIKGIFNSVDAVGDTAVAQGDKNTLSQLIGVTDGGVNMAVASLNTKAAALTEARSAQTTANALKANVSLSAAQQQLALSESAQTAGQTKVVGAQNTLTGAKLALQTAQTNATQAIKNASTFNQSLQQSVHEQYINQYANAVDTGRATNTAINLTGLINPTAVYNQYAVKGTSVVAPTTSLANSGITFKNGQPIISSNLQLAAIKNINPALSALSTTGGQVNQKPIAVA